MRIAIVFAAAMLTLASPASAPERAPATELEKTLYAVGVAAAESFRTFDLSPEELEMAQRGLRDVLTGGPVLVDMATYRSKVDAFAAERRAGLERKAAQSFAKRSGAQTTASGLVFVPLQAGSGPVPTATDVVKVDYTGTFADGTVFDSTAKKGEPATIPLERAIKCWKEALPMMKVGGKAQMMCPPSLAYGSSGLPKLVPPDSSLYFEIELLSIPARVVITDGPVPELPADVKKPAEGPAPAGGKAAPGDQAAPAGKKK
ncbi:MAG TPA: FKBP-type peptidyl-prolyl cis-trans isomerase [Anaeromyxobacteraceae bacterium]|nr:FKBP-type peptidyl-prolyl cis-trans isomerase [Anaeromyxobacteraceae bacterium]